MRRSGAVVGRACHALDLFEHTREGLEQLAAETADFFFFELCFGLFGLDACGIGENDFVNFKRQIAAVCHFDNDSAAEGMAEQNDFFETECGNECKNPI